MPGKRGAGAARPKKTFDELTAPRKGGRLPVLPSPDARDANERARVRNVKRGALPTGGPGRVERRKAVKQVAGARSVEDIQRMLNDQGFGLEVDGIIGPKTRAAMEQFNQTFRRGAAAERGYRITDAMYSDNPAPALRRLGLRGKELREALAESRRLRAHQAALFAQDYNTTLRPATAQQAEASRNPLLRDAMQRDLGAYEKAAIEDMGVPLTKSPLEFGGQFVTDTVGGLADLGALSVASNWNLLNDSVGNAIRGVGDLAGLDANYTLGSADLGKQMASGIYNSYKTLYWDPLSSGNIDQFLRNLRENPTMLWDFAGVASVAAKSAAIAALMREGVPARAAWRAVNMPNSLDASRVREMRQGAVDVQFPTSTNPLVRKAQEVYDAYSEKVDGTPVLGPMIGKTARVGREMEKQLRQRKRRQNASVAHQANRLTHHILPGVGLSSAERTRLGVEAQFPEHLRHEAVPRMIEYLQEQLEVPITLSVPESPRLRDARELERRLQAERDMAAAEWDADYDYTDAHTYQPEMDPVVSTRRDEIEQAMRSSNVPEEHLQAAMPLIDNLARQVARRRGVTPARAYSMLFSEVRTALQDGGDALFQLDRPNPFVFDEKTVALNRKRRDAVVADGITLKNEPRKVSIAEGFEIPIGDAITIQEMLDRIEQTTPEQSQRAVDAAFYHDVTDRLKQIFSDQEILAWLASQRSASPARGIMDLFRLLDQIREAGSVEAYLTRRSEGKAPALGVAIETMAQLLDGAEELSSGAKAKISDFVDSARRAETRAWMGNDPAYGSPAVADRWAYRSNGVMDADAVKILAARGIEVAEDVINDHTYEWVNLRYHQLRDLMNERNFDGRSDWTVEEAQAMDWAAIQRAWGVSPESMADAMRMNSRRVAMELSPGEGAPLLAEYPGLADLPAEKTDAILDEIVSYAAEASGVRVTERVHGEGGWLKDRARAFSFTVFGSPEGINNFAHAAAYLTQQTEVWATRQNSSKANLPYLDITWDDFTPEVRDALWEKLMDADEQYVGFQPLQNGIRVIHAQWRGPGRYGAPRGWNLESQVAIIQKAAEELKVEVDVGSGRAELLAAHNDWVEAPGGDPLLEGLQGGGAERLRGELLDSGRARVASAIEAAGVKRADVGPRHQGGEPHPAARSDYLPGMYSKLTDVLMKEMPERASVEQVRALFKKHGVKEGELLWTGVGDYLETAEQMKKKVVTKQELVDQALNPMVWIEEDSPIQDYASYTLEGKETGETPPNYQIVTIHARGPLAPSWDEGHFADTGTIAHYRIADAAVRGEDGGDLQKALLAEEIQSDWHQQGRKHGYDSPQDEMQARRDYNVALDTLKTEHEKLVHQAISSLREGKAYSERQLEEARHAWRSIRTDKLHGNDLRILAAVARSTGVEEFAGVSADAAVAALRDVIKASDRLDAFDRGWESSDLVPDAPLKKTWHELAMKRIIQRAVASGYDRVAWTTGAQQSERYELASVVDGVMLQTVPDAGNPFYVLSVKKKGEENYTEISHWLTEGQVERYVGKEMANRLLERPGIPFEGDDLVVGTNRGMVGFYDEMLPRFVSKHLKSTGVKAKVGEIELSDGSTQKIHYIDLTPEVKELVEKGQPVYQKDAGGVKGAFEPATRILTLVQGNADVTTLLHEGWHAFEPYLDPTEIEALERWSGTKRGTREFSEASARGFERYLREGKTPAQGLEAIFAKLKDIFVAVYRTARGLGKPLNAEVTKLFDEIIDSNKRKPVKAEQRDRLRAAEIRLEDARARRQRLERSHARKEANRDVKHLEALVDELADRAAKDPDTWGPRLERAERKLGEVRQTIDSLEKRREIQIGERIQELRQAEKVDTTSEKYQAAMDAMADLTAITEQIKLEAFGTTPEELARLESQFEGRRTLMGQELFGDDQASDVYMKHVGADQKGLGGVMHRPTNRRFGAASTQGLLGGPNELKRLRSGDISFDPAVVVQSYLRASAFQHVTDTRRMLADMGEPIAVGEMPKPGWYIVNPNGKTLPKWWDSDQLADDLEVADAIEELARNSIGERLGLDENGVVNLEGVFQVDPVLVHRMLGRNPYQASGAVGQAFDVAQALTKMSLLYLNPGYIPANLMGNLVFLSIDQPFASVPNLFRAGKLIKEDRPLAHKIGAEAGQGPTMGIAPEMGVGEGQFTRWTKGVTMKVADVVGNVPDDWPRIAAWIHYARKAGFKTRAQMHDLIDNPKHEKVRLEVSDRVKNAMVDFDKAGPQERATLSRVMFVWPWIRGASAWAARFPFEHPEKFALGSAAGAPVRDEAEEVTGQLESFYRNVMPVGPNPVRPGVAMVVNAGAMSPTSTLIETVDQAKAIYDSLVHNETYPKGMAPVDMMNPLAGAATRVVQGENRYGRQVGAREALVDELEAIDPLWKLGKDLVNPEGANTDLYPQDDQRLHRIGRSLRVFPYEIDLDEARKEDEKKSGPQGDYLEWTQKATKAAREKGLGGLPPEIVQARASKTRYQEERATLKKELGVNTLTDVQSLAVKVSLLERQGKLPASAVNDLLSDAKKYPEAVPQINTWVEKQLGWRDLERFNDLMGVTER